MADWMAGHTHQTAIPMYVRYMPFGKQLCIIVFIGQKQFIPYYQTLLHTVFSILPVAGDSVELVASAVT